MKFTSDRPGTYYYAIVNHGAGAPTINTSGAGAACIAGTNTITDPANLTAGAKDIYIVTKDPEGKLSDPIAIEIPVPNDVDLTTVTWQNPTTYTCGLEISPIAKMVTISVNSGYFTVPSLGSGVLTFLGGTNGSNHLSTYTSATQQFNSAVFSFTDSQAAESWLSGILYKPNGAASQEITASASSISPVGSDIYFDGHFYRYVSGVIDWPSAALAAGGTQDPYFGGRGYIATATSQAENSILLKLTDTGGTGSNHWYTAWMGGLWQRNTGTVASPNIVRGTDGHEVTYGDLSGATVNQRKNILLDYSLTFPDSATTYINAIPNTIKYYWLDGPEAGQEIAYNVSGFSPWHSGEPNTGDFIYIGWEGAYWDDLGANYLDNPANGFATRSGYLVEFSGFDGGSTEGIIKEDTKTVTNTAPTFISETTSLLVDTNSSDNDILSLLHISDIDNGQTLTWTELTAPSHGTLDISGATASAGSMDVTPGGVISYTPEQNYSGTDSFTIQVSDGTAVTTHTINVNVNDVIPPTGKIVVTNNQWSTFFNNITFGVFFKNTVSVSIEGTDIGSGIRKIEYCKAGTALSLQEIQGMNWTTYSNAFSITPTDAEQFVIYAKITDNAGNICIINSNGMVFDVTAPSISTDYTKDASSMKVTVGDSGSGVGVVTYTIDGGSPQTATLVDGKFTVASLSDGKYDIDITAKDELENERTLTVHVVSLHTVTYKLFDDSDAATLKTETVEYGDSGTAPADPTRTGFDFQEWDKSFSNVTADLTVFGTWDIGGITSTPYTGTFDGLPHDLVNVSGSLAGDTITYSTNGTEFSATCPQATNIGDYPVYVKVEREGYVAWLSQLKTATIDPKAITSDMISQLPSAEYTGQPLSPMPEVMYGTIPLVNTADFDISYSRNTDFGLADVTITGKGNYTGSVTTHFPIYAKNTDVMIGQGLASDVAVTGLGTLYQDKNIYTKEDSRIETVGGTAKIALSVKLITDATGDKALIEKAASGKTIGAYLDISLLKTVAVAGESGETTTKITHVNNVITVTIPIPDNIKGKKGIAMARVHDGVATLLPVGQENAIEGEYCIIDGQNITLHLCKFSTYAIGYDPAQTGTDDGGTKPDTGDNTSMMLFILLLCGSLLPMFLLRQKRQMNE